jgi:glycosyltransferase involved in cell wall biosynthesis
MFISLIVIAHDRREYLLDALSSVTNQNLDKQKYEVIVVKNFEDSLIDSYITNRQIHKILCKSPGLGSKIAAGVIEAKGDVITFLEDDDLFEPERLKYVFDSFLANQELIYFHNSFSQYDAKLNPIAQQKFRHVEKPLLLTSSQIDENILNQTFTNSIHANLSSIAIKKYILNQALQILVKTNGGEDLSFFLLSLERQGQLFFTEHKLTKVRIHDSFFTNNSIKLGNEKLLWKIKRHQNYLNTYRLMLPLLTKIGFDWLLRFSWKKAIFINILSSEKNEYLSLNKLFSLIFTFIKRKNWTDVFLCSLILIRKPFLHFSMIMHFPDPMLKLIEIFSP